MSIYDKLGQLPIRLESQKVGPVWAGPSGEGPQGGVTQSLLGRYLVCKERFRLLVIEGLTTRDRWNHKIQYGSMWHVCEEALAAGKDWNKPLYDYAQDLCSKYPMQQAEIRKWYEVCKVQFPEYVRFWPSPSSSQEKVKGQRMPLLQEEKFNVPYRLPSDRTVRLRGKWDSVYLENDGIWLQDNKTKGTIDEQQIRRQISYDLQMCFYLCALHLQVELDGIEGPSLRLLSGGCFPIKGVLFNVIRRPLSGGKGTIVQKKGSKNIPAETTEQYYARLAQYIKDEPATYFMRWPVEVSQEDIQRFTRTCLVPVLENLCDDWEWWELCKEHKVDPFDQHTRDSEFPYHLPRQFRMPFGVYSPLLDGGTTELDLYLETGSELGLTRTTDLFPELA